MRRVTFGFLACRVVLMITLGLYACGMSAQRTCVIADMENHLPLKDALIHTNNNHWARTMYTGQFAMKYVFDSATVSKQGYVPTTIYLANLPDTVFLLPEAKQLDEVTIIGKDQQHIQQMTDQLRQNAKDAAQPSTGASFDLANILDRRGRRDAKHRIEAKKVMDEHDMAGDPIVNAYNETMRQLHGKNAPRAKADGSGVEDNKQTEQTGAEDDEKTAGKTEAEEKATDTTKDDEK